MREFIYINQNHKKGVRAMYDVLYSTYIPSGDAFSELKIIDRFICDVRVSCE